MNLLKELKWHIAGLLLILVAMRIWGSDRSLDARFFYSGLEARKFFSSLSADQARSYFKNEIFDLGFITVYSLLFLSLFERFFGHRSYFKYLAFIPGIFDLIETVTIIGILLFLFNQIPNWLGIMTWLKWVSGILITLILIWQWYQVRPTVKVRK